MINACIVATGINEWCYIKEHTAYFVLRGCEFRVTIPQWYVFDGASIPRLFWTPLGLTPGGLLLSASGIHDWFYQNRNEKIDCEIKGFRGTWNKLSIEFSREESDWIFYQHINLERLSRFDTDLVYKYVRRYGWIVWGKKKKGVRFLQEEKRHLYI